MSITPNRRPELDIEDALDLGAAHGLINVPFLIGLRGFVHPGQNERGIYDDCIAIVDSVNFETFNANTDPSKFGRGIATLKSPQKCLYKIGTHNVTKEKAKQYTALVQAAPVTVQREGTGIEESGYFGINIHRGGNTTPGSEGCQTIPPLQWGAFMAAVYQTMRIRKLYTIHYLLVDA